MDLRELFSTNVEWLQQSSTVLAESAAKLTRVAMSAKVVTIVLGAIAATQGTAAGLLGDDSRLLVISYAAVGLIITAVAGLDAAFKFEERAAGRRMLAAEAHARAAEFLARWAEFESNTTTSETASVLTTDLIAYMGDVQTRAADVGVNLVWERVQREAAQAKGLEGILEGGEDEAPSSAALETLDAIRDYGE